jgi:hypothetical protein
MVLLGDEAQVEALLVRLEIVLILMQDNGLCHTYHRLKNHFGCT